MLVIGSVFSQIFRSVIDDANWNPSALFVGGEQGAWFDPSDITTLFQDNLGATPVTAAGQTVGKMLDKSGQGNHATQSVLAQRPTYQIDSSGLPYISFDGVDDRIATGSVTPTGDKAQVFAGVRKLSDASTSVIVETGTTGLESGILGLFGPSATGANSYRFASRGTVSANAGTGVFAAAPNTSVLTGLGDISGDVVTLRRNGSIVQTVNTDQGTGNYLASPLYIGRRGVSGTLGYNGRIYSLIVRFGASLTTDQITSTETWVNGKTGAY
jgi:hypothetical protein